MQRQASLFQRGCGRIMNTWLKTIFFLAIAALLLVAPLAVSADDDIQDPSSLTLPEPAALVSVSTDSTAPSRVRVPAAVAVIPSAVSLHGSSVRVAKFAPQDGRSTLLSLCLLRC